MMIDDVARTVAFYRDVLGFDVVMTASGHDEAPAWALLKRDGVELLFQSRDGVETLLEALLPPAPPAAPPRRRSTLTIYVDVDDVERCYRQVAPSCVVRELHDAGRGTREFSVRDCNGFILTFAGRPAFVRRAA